MNRVANLFFLLFYSLVFQQCFTSAIHAQYQHGLGAETEWKMKDGRKATGKFLQIEEGKLFLEFSGGRVLSYPLSRFDESSQLLARDRKDQFRIASSFNELKRLENKVTFAVEAVKLYQQFLDFELNKQKTDDLQRARKELIQVEQYAQQNCIRVADRYQTREQIEEIRKRNVDTVVASFAAARANDWKKAISLLERASRFDQSSFDANFVLGLLAACVERDLVKAESMFTVCVNRGKQYTPLFGDKNHNLPAALVNLGLIKMRNGNLSDAESCFRDAVKTNPKMLDVILMNCNRMQKLIKYSVVKGNSSMVKLTEKSSEIISKIEHELNSDQRGKVALAKGWIYVCQVSDVSKLSTFPVDSKLAAGRFELTKISDREAITDFGCNFCNGLAALDCLNRKCTKGTVRVFQKRTIKSPDGQTQVQGFWGREKCDTCNGVGRRACTECRDGVDLRSYR